MTFRRLLAPALLPFLLVACSHQEWMKPGSTPSDFGRDQYQCMQEAMASAPPIITNEVAWTGGGKQTSWSPNGGKDRTDNGGGSVVPVDVNADNRAMLADSCMRARGWQLVTVKDQ